MIQGIHKINLRTLAPSHHRDIFFKDVAPTADQVRFGQRHALLKKYQIDPKTIRVEAPPGVTLKNKALLLEKILEAHEQAVSNAQQGNFSGFHYASNALIQDSAGHGVWGLGTNLEVSREITLCGERSAFSAAWNRFLKKYPNQSESPKVKVLAMSSYKPIGEDPAQDFMCGECISWMASSQFFTPNTLIISLLKSGDKQNPFVLKVKTRDQYLPKATTQQASWTTLPATSLTCVLSHKATQALEQRQHLSENPPSVETLQRLFDLAKATFETYPTYTLSGKPGACAVLLSNGEMAAGSRFDITQRWFVPPDITLASQALQKHQQNEQPGLKVIAVAYVGYDPQTPGTAQLGMLAQPRLGSPDTLVVTASHDTLNINTIADYLPILYTSTPRPQATHKPLA